MLDRKQGRKFDWSPIDHLDLEEWPPLPPTKKLPPIRRRQLSRETNTRVIDRTSGGDSATSESSVKDQGGRSLPPRGSSLHHHSPPDQPEPPYHVVVLNNAVRVVAVQALRDWILAMVFNAWASH